MIEFLKTLGDNLGWLSNIVGVVTAIASFCMVLFGVKFRAKIMKLFFREKFNNIKDYVNKNESLFNENIVAKIAIIDDELENFPIDYLRKLGHEVFEMRGISLSEIGILEKYDFVFLDMIGVVKEDKEKGALELIKKARNLTRRPYIVAVSKATFDPTATDYFKLADDVAKKPINEISCDELVEEYRKVNSPKQCASKIDDILNQKSVPKKVRDVINDAIILGIKKEISYSDIAQKIDVTPANFSKDELIKLVGILLGRRKDD